MFLMEKVFDVPTIFVAKYVSDQMRKETSFIIEGELPCILPFLSIRSQPLTIDPYLDTSPSCRPERTEDHRPS
jgi:hypothetical protein